MEFKFRHKRDPEERDEKREEETPRARTVRVTLDIGASGRRTAEISLDTDHPTVEYLITRAIETFRSSDDFSDQVFGDMVAQRYGDLNTTVERRIGENFYPISRSSEIELMGDEFSFSLAVDHVGGGYSPRSQLGGMALKLSTDGCFAWDGRKFFVWTDSGRFQALTEIPFCEAERRYQSFLKIAWFLSEFRKYLEDFLEGKPLPKEPICYPFNDIDIHLKTKNFTSPGIYIKSDKGGFIYELRKIEEGSRKLIYHLLRSRCKYHRGVVLEDQIYIVGNHIGSLEDYVREYEEEMDGFYDRIPEEARRLIDNFKNDTRGYHMGRVIFYERSGWRLLYRYPGGCVIEKEGTPFVMEGEDGKFYIFDEPYAVGVILSPDQISAIVEGKLISITPVMTYPRPFRHPFVNSDNSICTNTWAESYFKNEDHIHVFSGIIDILITTLQILRLGYSGEKEEGKRFTPYNSLTELGRPKLSSLKKALATGYPVYRFYIEDRR